MPAGHECTLRNHESRENDFLGGENRALLKFSGFEELSHTILTGFICVPVYRIFVVKDIFHHALRRVRQWSQFLLDSITTFNFSTGVMGRSFGYTLTSGRGLFGL